MAYSNELRTVRLSDFPPATKDVLDALPVSLVRQKMIVPVSKSGGRLTAAVPHAEGVLKPQGLQMIAHCPVDLVLAPLDEIIAFIKKHYGDELSQSVTAPAAKTATLPVEFHQLIESAVKNKASELLLECSSDKTRIRQRIRGVVVGEFKSHMSGEQAREIFSFVTKQAKSENKRDGAWSAWNFCFSDQDQIVNCSAVQSQTRDFQLLTVHFEFPQEKMFSPSAWGLGPQQARTLEAMLQKKQGMILFCGLDNDDFRSNLKACAKELSTAEKHVICVSNSGWEWLPGVETLVTDGTDANFSELLDVAFRHKPDVVFVDALEKSSDLDLCLRLSMRGTLVLSHMYARDASDAFVRLLSAETDVPLLSTALLGILAQRSLRLICPRCQEKDPIHRDRVRDMGIPLAMQPPSFYRGRGCESCLKTGFDRETNIFEVIEMNDTLRSMLSHDKKPDEIRTHFKNSGFLSLRQVAIHKAINGQTSLAEVLRVTP